jgi:uncharacterized protein (DUF4415 family)
VMIVAAVPVKPKKKLGRPAADPPKLKVCITVDEDLIEEVDRRAIQEGRSRSSYINQSLRLVLNVKI